MKRNTALNGFLFVTTACRVIYCFNCQSKACTDSEMVQPD